MSAYVTHFSSSKLRDPILLADVKELPAQHSPIHDKDGSLKNELHEDVSVYSVVKNKEFSDKTAKEISALFGEVAYFEAQQSNPISY